MCEISKLYVQRSSLYDRETTTFNGVHTYDSYFSNNLETYIIVRDFFWILCSHRLNIIDQFPNYFYGGKP